MTDVAMFPSVEGDNLAGRHFALPRELEHELAILLIAFRREQQADVDTWLPVARAIEDRHRGVCVYELPTLDRMNRVSRFLLDHAMRRGIADPRARAHTITLYVDKARFREALAIASEDAIEVLLVDRDGRVAWRWTGRCCDDARTALEAAVETALRDRAWTPGPV